MTRMRGFALVLLLAAAAPSVARADDETPWSRGVTAEQRETAQRLLEEGNDLFVENEFPAAIAKYEEAIASWDHPAIRFNIVRALIALDKPLEAYENLEKALAFGKDPLEEQVYMEAINYRTLLEGRIAEVKVSCAQRGVAIRLDGDAFLDCPGNRTVRLLPGAHAIVGRKDGYLTSTQDLVLLPGKATEVDVTLSTLDAAAVTRQRWATWKPWAVAGGGVALAGLGVLVNAKASADMDRFEREVARECADVACPGDRFGDLESTAKTENRIAIGMMIAGAAVAVTGVTLVILNRPRTFVPTASPEGAGLALVGSF
jgi:tetratricopeptide (TPR) repeat protein